MAAAAVEGAAIAGGAAVAAFGAAPVVTAVAVGVGAAALITGSAIFLTHLLETSKDERKMKAAKLRADVELRIEKLRAQEAAAKRDQQAADRESAERLQREVMHLEQERFRFEAFREAVRATQGEQLVSLQVLGALSAELERQTQQRRERYAELVQLGYTPADAHNQVSEELDEAINAARKAVTHLLTMIGRHNLDTPRLPHFDRLAIRQ